MGHYLLDLRVFQVSLRHHHADRLWPAFLEGYGDERALPEEHVRYLRTFAAMLGVAAVNRQLGLLGSEDGDRRPAKLLKNSVVWLERLSERW